MRRSRSIRHLLIAATCVAAISGWPLRAQTPAATPATDPDAVLRSLPQIPEASPSSGPAGDAAQNPGRTDRGPFVEPGDPARNTNDSYWLDHYPLNDLYQYLARQAGLQYFHSDAIAPLNVTGELFKNGDAFKSMQELALQYNLVLYRKGRTIYALTKAQIADLPQHEFRYELKYLHLPTKQDSKEIKQDPQEDVQRMLGQFLTDPKNATFEPQVNTIVVNDNETVIRKVAQYLQSIDVPRRQVSIQVRVISVTTSGDKYTGIDWSQTLGQQGLALSASAQSNLDAAFGFRPSRSLAKTATAAAVGLSNEGTNVIIGPVTVTAVLHALFENARAHEENAPLVITEDNQQAAVRVLTRTPIVSSTVTATAAGSNTVNEVRYYLDASDRADHREIGTTLLVTPSILPDETIRLQIDGTVATVVGEQAVTSNAGTSTATNNYPIVNEAHLVNLARVPSGYSLILGGFVTLSNSQSNNKVPILGSIPLLGAAFRNKQITRTRTNLAFIITPIAFQAANPGKAVAISQFNRGEIIGPEQDLEDPDLVGRAQVYMPDLRNSLSNGQESDKNTIDARKPRKSRTERKYRGNEISGYRGEGAQQSIDGDP